MIMHNAYLRRMILNWMSIVSSEMNLEGKIRGRLGDNEFFRFSEL